MKNLNRFGVGSDLTLFFIHVYFHLATVITRCFRHLLSLFSENKYFDIFSRTYELKSCLAFECTIIVKSTNKPINFFNHIVYFTDLLCRCSV